MENQKYYKINKELERYLRGSSEKITIKKLIAINSGGKQNSS